MEQYAYYNGKVGKWEEISIPLSDRSVFFADAVYDAAIGTDKAGIYLCEKHVSRLFSCAEAIGIKHSFSEKELISTLEAFIKYSGLSSYFLYFQLSALANERQHAPRGSGANLLITAKPHLIPSHELKLISYPDRRHSLCHIKTTNLLGAVLAAEAAHEADADEAVLLRGEYVTECAHSNISIISGGTLITHPKSEHILPGIMRGELIRHAGEMNIPIMERPFSRSELLSADDVLVTSTTRLVNRASRLDGIDISRGNHEIGDRLIAILRKDYDVFCSN